ARIEDAALLLDPVLNPGATKPPPNDDEIVRAMEHAAQSLEEVPGAESGDAAARDARRLARALRNIAAGGPAVREHAKRLLIPGLESTLRQLRTALTAQ